MDAVAQEQEGVNERWVSAEVVAEHLDMTAETVRVMARTKKIPASKIGQYWRFRLSELDAWLSSPTSGTDDCRSATQGG